MRAVVEKLAGDAVAKMFIHREILVFGVYGGNMSTGLPDEMFRLGQHRLADTMATFVGDHGQNDRSPNVRVDRHGRDQGRDGMSPRRGRFQKPADAWLGPAHPIRRIPDDNPSPRRTPPCGCRAPRPSSCRIRGSPYDPTLQSGGEERRMEVMWRRVRRWHCCRTHAEQRTPNARRRMHDSQRT